jgi:hypothetical protein
VIKKKELPGTRDKIRSWELHSNIVTAASFFIDSSVDADNEKPLPGMILSELCRFAVNVDEKYLLKYIFAIGTGNVLHFDMQLLAANVSYEAQLLAVFVATEMLVRINSPKLQWLQMSQTRCHSIM